MSVFSRGAWLALGLVGIAAAAHASPCASQATERPVITAGQPLTLPSILAEVRNASPDVRAAALEARALSADADQAARRLNPVLSLELENFAGGGALSGFGQTETTLAVEQTFRLGGKRGLSERAARARAAVATAKCEIILLQTELEASLLFAELVAASELRDLARDGAYTAGQLTGIVERRVDAGAAAPPELLRAKSAEAALRARLAILDNEVERLRHALALLWNEDDPDFGPPIASALSPASLSTSPAQHPALTQADAAVTARNAEIDLAKRQALPDLTAMVGVRRFEETNEQALVAGVSVPLPLFDRGRDAARASSLRGQVALLDRARIERRLLAERRMATGSRDASQRELATLTSKALPAAQAAYEAALRGYEVGRFDLTATLNARKALLDTQIAIVEAQHRLQSEELRLRALTQSAPFNGTPS